MASASPISNWNKFRLLMWKNWILTYRRKWSTLSEVLVPIFVFSILLLLRTQDPVKVPARTYPPIDVSVVPSFPNILPQLAFVANDHSGDEIIHRAETLLNFTTSVRLENEQKLQDYLTSAKGNRTYAGIVLLHRNDTYSVTIRFPGYLRSLESSDWSTNQLFLIPYSNAVRNKGSFTGGYPPGYYEQGFVAIQNAMSRAILHDRIMPTIVLQRFPEQAYISDMTLHLIGVVLGLFTVLCFSNVFTNNVALIMGEKSGKLKELMRVMGLPNWLHWTAWFVKMMCYLIVLSTLIVVMLKLHYMDTVAIFALSNPFLIWLLLVAYSASITTFTFMMSTFFSSDENATLCINLLFCLTMLPYVIQQNTIHESPLYNEIATCLFSNSGLSLGMSKIIELEDSRVGLQWSNFVWTHNKDGISVFVIITILLFNTLVHLLIALYVEQVFPGKYGIPRKWYFFIESYLKDRTIEYDMVLKERTAETAPKVELVLDNTRPGIVLSHLTKHFDYCSSVEDLSFTMYKNEITVLLGENGAGKSTTMAMLTGVIPPSLGTAYINGLDIRTDMTAIRNSMGLCLQENVLFDLLTPREHILFYSRLKGFTKAQAKKEVTKYLTKMDLLSKANVHSKKLSGGMKRKLCLAIAFCGNSKVVLCDEPSSGMDPEARRQLWNFMQEEKKSRTIVLSTHFMDEAEVLGDRVAILQHGELQCYGSAHYLKNVYESAYKLICVVRRGSKKRNISALIRKYVPDARIVDSYGQETTYELSPIYASHFERLFKELEDNSSTIGVDSFGIVLPSLEDVFFKVLLEHKLETDSVNFSAVNSQHNIRIMEDYNGGQHVETGYRLLVNQFKGIFYKRHCHNRRNTIALACQILLPSVLLTFLHLLSKNATTLGPLVISLEGYREPNVLLSGSPASNYTQAYTSLFNRLPNVLQLTDDISEYIAELKTDEWDIFKRNTIIGADLTDTVLTAYFNNQPLHSIPLTLSTIYNAVGSKTNQYISFVNHPLPFVARSDITDLSLHDIMVMLKSFLLSQTLCIVVGLMVMFYVKERASKATQIQLISGISPTRYWLISFLFDMLVYTCSVILVICVFSAQERAWHGMGSLFCVLLGFGVSALPFVYLRSMRYTSPSSAYSNVVLLGMLLGMFLYGIIAIAKSMKPDIFLKVHTALLLIPFYNIMACIMKWIDLEMTPSESFWDWNEGLSMNIMFYVISGILGLTLSILNDAKKLNWMYYPFSCKSSTGAVEDLETDADVRREREMVNNMSQRDLVKKHLVIKNLRKCYKKMVAVQDVTFAVGRGECLGLWGKNGAGKSTTFKMLTGEEVITSGKAWIRGFDIRNDLIHAYRHTGYCPQTNALLDDLTGRETLKIICLFRGVAEIHIPEVIHTMARELGFSNHVGLLTKEMSGGTKRKLCTAQSLVGQPAIVFLDEPTTGMDPSAKRNLWKVITKYRATGNSIILTSHSIEECEALCTRLAILKQGKLEAIATSYQLKRKHTTMGRIVIHLERDANAAHNLKQLKRFVEEHLNGAVLKEEYQGRLTYDFNADQKLSTLFGMIEAQKESLRIQSYTLTNQNTLESVLLNYTAGDPVND